MYLFNISEPVQYAIYALAFLFDLGCESGTHYYNYTYKLMEKAMKQRRLSALAKVFEHNRLDCCNEYFSKEYSGLFSMHNCDLVWVNAYLKVPRNAGFKYLVYCAAACGGNFHMFYSHSKNSVPINTTYSNPVFIQYWNNYF